MLNDLRSRRGIMQIDSQSSLLYFVKAFSGAALQKA